MEAASGAPDTIVIGKDEEDQIQVQPVAEGGSRSVEIRLWRHGQPDSPPARDLLDLDLPDLDSLLQGIVELLEASEGGTRVARIVLDTAEGRRLRVETEPFGTRFVARIVFWQRTRVTWRPDGDPIVLPSQALPALHEALESLRPWLDDPADRQMTAAIPIVPEPWPNPGADWLTVTRSSVAFHPRGIRITCTVEEGDGDHRLEIRQWRREDSLWVPERVSLRLSVADLDAMLTALHTLSGTSDPASLEAGEHLRVSIAGDTPDLVIDRRMDGTFERSVAFPLDYLPRFGRALSQSFTLLVGWLSDTEREHLREERQIEVDEPVEEPPVEEAPPPTTATPQPLGPMYRFGEGSETPGVVVPQEGQVRIVLEGFLMPRGLTLPAAVVSRVITGLEELAERQKTESRVPPVLMFDRPDCSVYGRVGTNIRPDAVELRVWTGPRSSDAVTFEKTFLPDVIEALRKSARLLGQPEPFPMPSGERSSPGVSGRREDLETTMTVPAVKPPAEPEPAHVGDIEVGSQRLALDLRGPEARRLLCLSWDGGSIRLPTTGLEDMLTDVRALYYDALRGVRGRSLSVEDPPVEIALLSRGTELQIEFRDGSDSLSFPAREIPAFLNATREALNTKE